MPADVALRSGGSRLPMIDCVSYATYDLVGNALGLVALCGVPFLLMTRHGRGLAERLGRRPLALRSLRHPVWIHAASVGEVLAAQPLIRQLRVRRPDLPILISTTSVTGRETARAHLGAEAVMLSPLDLGWIVAHLLRRVQPCCLIIVETELWPALIRAASRRHTPVLVVSGRLSERSAVHYGWIRPLTRAVLRRVSAFAMQTEADASRILALGAPPARVQVVGSLKFARETTRGDAVDDTLAAEVRALLAGRRILIAASTHAGEERMVLEACAGLEKWINCSHRPVCAGSDAVNCVVRWTAAPRCSCLTRLASYPMCWWRPVPCSSAERSHRSEGTTCWNRRCSESLLPSARTPATSPPQRRRCCAGRPQRGSRMRVRWARSGGGCWRRRPPPPKWGRVLGPSLRPMLRLRSGRPTSSAGIWTHMRRKRPLAERMGTRVSILPCLRHRDQPT
jgi:hypothetical protein